jgi:hypothetical protein
MIAGDGEGSACLDGRNGDGPRRRWCQRSMGRDGNGARRLGPGGNGRNGDGARRLGPGCNGRDGEGSACLDGRDGDGPRWRWCQRSMGRDGDGAQRLGPGGDGRDSDGARRLKRSSLAGEADEADGDIELDGARLMRPMMLKRPSPAGEADEAEEAITGVTIE